MSKYIKLQTANGIFIVKIHAALRFKRHFYLMSSTLNIIVEAIFVLVTSFKLNCVCVTKTQFKINNMFIRCNTVHLIHDYFFIVST